MEDSKPWALISDNKPIYDELMDAVTPHFQVVCLKDLLQNPLLHGPKVQALFMWKGFPKSVPSLLSLLPSLKVISSCGVGRDHLDLPYINSLGVTVTHTPSTVTNATADMAMSLLLASARNIVEGFKIVVDPNISDLPCEYMGVDVSGSTMGIIGMGRIGSKIAQRGKGFDMKILYHNRSQRSVEVEEALGASYCENLDDLLKESDFVVLALTLTPETRGLIGHRELALMKPTATLVNIARGLIVDQDALVEALQSGTIRAAALDVTYPEPLPRDHPLLGLPNVLITPHCGINTLSTFRKTMQMMVDNALAVLEGSKHRINPPQEK